MSDLDINKKITESIRIASLDLNQKIEISLIEQLVSLVNNGIIDVTHQMPYSEFNFDRTKASISSAVGVKFKGKERIIELQSQLSSTQEELERAKKRLSEAAELVRLIEEYSLKHRIDCAGEYSHKRDCDCGAEKHNEVREFLQKIEGKNE